MLLQILYFRSSGVDRDVRKGVGDMRLLGPAGFS